ncbi:nucleobase:cation symporter-2 family protein [Streptomyces sp. NPDC051561]|uniref:nucleobase:cation symporter-2 family protein n=1 Tax=Streptomyces sp. NPDC051561 TaxID=3365658 RepID=UPI0037B56DF3
MAQPSSRTPVAPPPAAPPALHPVDRRPRFGKLAAFGFQHVLIMYTGCVTVPLVFGAAAGLDRATIGLLINADLLVAGLITLVQSLGVGKVLGIRLPIVTGATFSSVIPMIMIHGEYGMQAVYGSMLAAGLFGLLIAVPFARLVRFFPPLVSGVVIVVIGLSLLDVAGVLITGNDHRAADYASPARLALAAGVIVVIVLFSRFARGFLSQVGILLALVLGTLVAIPLGLTDFAGAAGADWFGLTAPFHFGAPQFPPSAVISMCVVMLVIFTESTATMMAVGESTGRTVSDKDLARGLAADGLSGVLGGAMNSFMDTVFTQNVGLIRMTGVSSRYVTAVAGGMLVLLGLVPRLGELVAALPGPVIGAAGLMLFATVTMVGVNTLRRVDLDDHRNLTVAAVALGIGLLPEFVEGVYDGFPSWVRIILGSGITGAACAAFLLNLLFHHTGVRQQSRTGGNRSTIGESEGSDPTDSDGVRGGREVRAEERVEARTAAGAEAGEEGGGERGGEGPRDGEGAEARAGEQHAVDAAAAPRPTPRA